MKNNEIMDFDEFPSEEFEILMKYFREIHSLNQQEKDLMKDIVEFNVQGSAKVQLALRQTEQAFEQKNLLSKLKNEQDALMQVERNFQETQKIAAILQEEYLSLFGKRR